MFDQFNLLVLLLIPFGAYVVGAFLLACYETFDKQQGFLLSVSDSRIQDGH